MLLLTKTVHLRDLYGDNVYNVPNPRTQTKVLHKGVSKT